jgi:ribonuclease P protein component
VDLGPLVFRVSKRDAGPGRLGLAISKKVGNSPERNHVKRRVRECFRLRQRSFDGFDLVAIGRAGAADLSTADVARLFDQLAQRLQPPTRRPSRPE